MPGAECPLVAGHFLPVRLAAPSGAALFWRKTPTGCWRIAGCGLASRPMT